MVYQEWVQENAKGSGERPEFHGAWKRRIAGRNGGGEFPCREIGRKEYQYRLGKKCTSGWKD